MRDYQRLETREAIESYLASIPKHTPVAIAIEAEEMDLDFRALGISFKAGEARALSLQYPELLRPLLEDAEWPKIAGNVKSALVALQKLGIEARGFEHDLMLYAFLLDADPSAGSLTALAQRRFDLKLGPAPEQQADCAFELYEKLSPEVDARGLRQLYETMDLPLTGVLARMESTGIRIDPVELRRLSVLMDTTIKRLTEEIHAIAGKPFNISSPQQLGKVLFEDLRLPAPVRYGKGKTISTAADILEELAAEHEIVRKGARIPAAHQAEGHLRRRAAGADSRRPPGVCIPASTRRGRPPGGSRRRIPICRTSPSGRSWGAKSAPRSCRARAGS